MSKDSWDNYKGLQVPPKHGDLFRAMDQQERFYAEIMKMNEISIQNAFNQALSIQLCKFIHKPLNIVMNSIFKFYQKMSHSFTPILNRHSPFCSDIINCQV